MGEKPYDMTGRITYLYELLLEVYSKCHEDNELDEFLNEFFKYHCETIVVDIRLSSNTVISNFKVDAQFIPNKYKWVFKPFTL